MSDGMIVGLCFLLVSVVLGLVDIVCVSLQKKKRIGCNVQVEARIVDSLRYYRRGADGNEHFYYAVYEYQYNGLVYRSESKYGTNACPKVGKQRTIYLNPNNPEEYIEKRFLSYLHIVILSAISGIFGIIGLLLVLAGLF